MLKESGTLFGQYAKLQLQAASHLWSIFIVSFLGSLLLLAILRLFTGLSIKRFGYLALCGISFRSKTGKHIKIGRLGLHLHRPTVARPGWFEIIIKNCEIIDPQPHAKTKKAPKQPEPSKEGSIPSHFSELFEKEIKSIPLLPESQVWARRIVKWLIVTLKVVNISVNSLSVNVEGTNYVVSSVSLRLDLRNLVPLRNSNFVGTLDAYKLKPTEIRIALALSISEFFVAESLDDENPHPILDNFSFNTTGVLDKKSLDLKELSFQIAVHNVHIQLENLLNRLKKNKTASKSSRSPGSGGFSRSKRVQLARVGVALVYLVKEIDIKFNSVEITEITPPHDIFDKNGNLVRLILNMTDVSYNVRRMNPLSPGFKLLYSDSTAAHQATLRLSSINFGIDAGGVQEELIYIPLITVLSQTDLASKSLNYIQDENAKINDSIIKSAFNVNSPSLNIETHHLPILLQLANNSKKNKTEKSGLLGLKIPSEIQNALPRADLSMHVSEAALRIVFDGEETPQSMFITSCSRILGRLEGSHQIADGREVYTVDQDLEIVKGLVWYRSDLVPRFVISSSERILFHIAAVTQPQLAVDIEMSLSNVNHTLTRYEIFHAIRCLVQSIRPPVKKEEGTLVASDTTVVPSNQIKMSPLRKIPAWLRTFTFDVKKIKIVLASERFRGQTLDLAGVQIELGSMQIKYETGKDATTTDGRSIGVDLDALELCCINTDHVNKPTPTEKIRLSKPNLLLPSLQVMLSTKSLEDGTPHVAAFIKIPSIKISYSMNVTLSISVVREVVDHAYGRDLLAPRPKNLHKISEKMDITTEIDYANYKAKLPNNEDIMLTITYGILEYFPSTGFPHFSCQGIKLYSLHPFNNKAWCVIMSLVKPVVDVNMASKDDQIMVSVEGFRVNVPFDFKLYRIIDNAITFVKAVRTLIKQTKLRDPLFILPPKEAKVDPHIPRVGVKAKSLALTLEDDPFESDLNLIFQTLRHENEARLQKEQILANAIKLVLKTDGLSIVDQYAEKIHERLISRTSTSTAASNAEFDTNRARSSLKHSATEQFLCRTCKHGKKRSGAVLGFCNNSHNSCLFCKGDNKSHKIRNRLSSTIGNDDSSQEDSIKDVAKELRTRIERLIDSHMDLIANDTVASEATNGWADMWSSPEFYPWRQLKISTDTLKELGVPVDTHEFKKDEKGITIHEARKRLLSHHNDSWIRSITDAKRSQSAGAKKTFEQEMPDTFDEITCTDEPVVGYSPRPLLFNASFRDVYWQVDRSKFDSVDDMHDFVYSIGKGVPKDMRYSIFVPLYFNVRAEGGFNLRLRDYPLPVLNFPGLSAMQDPRGGAALQISGNFIIAEQLSHSKAQVRPLFVPLFPDTPHRHFSDEKTPSWAVVEVHRTLSPVRMLTDLKFTTNSDLPTRFCWCSAYKPAFQSMQNRFSSFSKPPIDASAPMGFWDKIRLTFHARLKFDLKKSSLYFLLKGDRSPYSLIRGGAGFAFIWDKNVTVDINRNDDPKRLFVVKAEVFKTVIPNYSAWEREYISRLPGERAYPLRSDLKTMTLPQNQKVVMKFSNATEWILGMSFQRKVDQHKKQADYEMERTDEFRPHYDVNLTMPDFVEDPETYDAYHGFRSDFVFLAISVRSLESMGEPGGWNAVHLSPLVLRHFMVWKEQFKNVLWPPTRAGKLFPGETAKKTKLGSVLSGQQYQLALEPLYISFMARHLSHHGKNQILAGAKARVDKFVLDLHTRKEPVGSYKRWGTKLYQGQVNATNMEVRVISATMFDSTVRQAHKWMREGGADDSDMASLFGSNVSSEGPSGYTSQTSSHVNSITESKRPTHTDWIDYDDLTDIGYELNRKSKPKVVTKNFIYTSHLSYVKETDRSGEDVGEIDGHRYLKFGRELIHDCLFSDESAWNIHQKRLASRRKNLRESAEDNKASLENLTREQNSYPDNPTLAKAKRETQEVIDVCEASIKTLSHSISVMEQSKTNIPNDLAVGDRAHIFRNEGEVDSFLNQVVVHSVNVKWDDDVRDLVMRLKLLFSLHKEGVYTRSRRALKYLSDLVTELEEQANKKDHGSHSDSNEAMKTIVEGKGAKCEIIKDDDEESKCNTVQSAADNFSKFKKALSRHSDNEALDNSLLLRFITPQFQVVSLRNPDKCVQITSRAIDVRQLKVYEAYNDDVDWDAAEIESRYGVVIDKGNLFTFSKENMSRTVISNLCSADYHYMNETGGYSDPPPVGSVPWPPWLGVEFCIDPGVLRKFLLVPDIELCLRYNKLNEQHVQSEHSVLKANNDTIGDSDGHSATTDEDDLADNHNDHHKTSRFSQLIVDAPYLKVQCNSDQYFTAYTIVKDLLHYTDPMSEDTDKATERIALVIDVSSDYRHSLSQVMTLQNNLNMIVRLIDNISATRMHSNDTSIDRDITKLELEYRRASMDLMITMRAFKAALRRSNRTDTADILYTTLTFDKVLMTTLNNNGKPFMKMGFVSGKYRNFTRGEQFSHTAVKLGLLEALNLVEDAFYPDVISPHGEVDPHKPFVRVEWTTLDPVGGIPIVENVFVDIHPIKVQLERNLYNTLHGFAFPKDSENTIEDSQHVSTLPEYDEDDFSGLSESDDSDSADQSVTSGKKLSIVPGFAKRITHLVNRTARPTAEVNELVDRAAKYMNVTKFTIKETAIVASYKGTDSSNLLDVQDIAINVPKLEYINKLWTKKDLFNRLKKDLVKLVLSNTGQILGNKFTRHKKKRTVSDRFGAGSALERINTSASNLFSSNSGATEATIHAATSTQPMIVPSEWHSESKRPDKGQIVSANSSSVAPTASYQTSTTSRREPSLSAKSKSKSKGFLNKLKNL